jgi:hypothetical protein
MAAPFPSARATSISAWLRVNLPRWSRGLDISGSSLRGGCALRGGEAGDRLRDELAVGHGAVTAQLGELLALGDGPLLVRDTFLLVRLQFAVRRVELARST